MFALSEAGGSLIDLGPKVALDPDALCRAEVRVETPAATWTARLASTIWAEPAGSLWDTAGLLIVTFGFHAWAFDARTGDLRWSHRSASPIIALLGSPRLDLVIVQAEIETFGIDPDGTVAWRLAHSDVVSEAQLVGRRLVLTSYTGQTSVLDPATGRAAT